MIELTIHHVIHSEAVTRVEGKLDQVLTLLIASQQREVTMVQELDDLVAQVSRNTDVEQSALVLIQGIVPRIQAAIDAALAAGAPPAVLAAIVAEKTRLSASAESLAAAVAANTPAA